MVGLRPLFTHMLVSGLKTEYDVAQVDKELATADMTKETPDLPLLLLLQCQVLCASTPVSEVLGELNLGHLVY